MSVLRKSPVAIFCSDVHFSDKAPSARSDEDWKAVMRYPWDLLRSRFGSSVPIFVAGDIFDHWKPSPELINFVLDLFRGLSVYAVPGQHDLPGHNYEDMHKSGYGTLSSSGAIVDIREPVASDVKVNGKCLRVFGFPWGFEPEDDPTDDFYNVAISHRFVWVPGKGFLGAPESQLCKQTMELYAGFDLAFFGDNHKPFKTKPMKPHHPCVINCGGLYRRKSDERDHTPAFYILCDDGNVFRFEIKQEEERWTVQQASTENEEDGYSKAFLDHFESLVSDKLDFKEAVKHMCEASGLEDDVLEFIDTCLDFER